MTDNTEETQSGNNTGENTNLLSFEQVQETCWISMDGFQTKLVEKLTGDDFHSQIKLACFDFDYTLVRPKSGSLFSKDADDWMLCFPNVKAKLQELWQDGFQIVIFSNQMGVKTNKTTVGELTKKFTAFQKEVEVPLVIAFATDDDYYRKPLRGMWEEVLLKMLNAYQAEIQEDDAGIKVTDTSFYCGDAAGRSKNWRPGARKDFSRSDTYFAHNNRLSFRVPEQVFEDMPLDTNTFATDIYDNLDWTQLNGEIRAKTIKMGDNVAKNPRMTIMIGTPSSGKSTFAQKMAQEENCNSKTIKTVVVNMDTFKTKPKCLKVVKEAVNKGQNIIIDNTNPAAATRQEYLDLAAQHDPPYNTQAIWLDTPDLISRHLNYLRVQQTQGARRRIPPVAFGVFHKKFEEPTLAEGFHSIVRKAPLLAGEELEAVKEYKFDI